MLQAWSLRAAPYIFPTRDAAVFTVGLLPGDEASMRAFIYAVVPALDKVGVSALQVIALCGGALHEVLSGRVMTKDELGVALAEKVKYRLAVSQRELWESASWYVAGQSLGESIARFALPVLALQGLCCHVQRKGRQAYYGLTEEWLGAPAPISIFEQARAELARRFLHCYGPATAAHFAVWAGIAAAQAEQAWSLVANELVAVHLEGQAGLCLRADLDRLQSSPEPAGVRLLPPHDPYLSMPDRTFLVPNRALQRQVWKATVNPGIVLVDGRLVAIWHTKKKGSRLNIPVECFFSLTAKTRVGIEAEAALLAPFKGCSSAEVEFKMIE
jgi:hypothetical protein